MQRMAEINMRKRNGNVSYVADLTVKQLAVRYLDWLRLNERSVNYIKSINVVFNTCGPILELKARKLNKAVFDQWVATRRSNGLSQSSAATQYRIIHAVLEFALSRELITTNPLAKYRLPAAKPRAPYNPTPDEFQRLFDAISCAGQNCNNDLQKLLYFALATGARIGEIIDLDTRQISGNIVTIVGKGGWERKFEIPPLPFVINQSGHAFTYKGQKWNYYTVLSLMKKACAAAGLPTIKIHTLRHAHATYELANGTSIRDLMVRCGWRSLNIMQRYVLSRTIKPFSPLPQMRTQFGHHPKTICTQKKHYQQLTKSIQITIYNSRKNLRCRHSTLNVVCTRHAVTNECPAAHHEQMRHSLCA